MLSDITQAVATSTTAPATSSASSTVGTNRPSSQASTPSHSNAGAIAGGVVGGVVFLAGVVLAGVWFLLRRRGWRNRAMNRKSVNLDEDDVRVPPPPTDGYTSDRTVTSPMTSSRTPYVHVRACIFPSLRGLRACSLERHQTWVPSSLLLCIRHSGVSTLRIVFPITRHKHHAATPVLQRFDWSRLQKFRVSKSPCSIIVLTRQAVQSKYHRYLYLQ